MTIISETGRARHIEESMKLDAQGYATLLQIRMRPPGAADILLYLTPSQKLTWQGRTWEDWPLTISGDKRSSDGEHSRPTLSLFNPKGVFTQYINEGYMDSAEITRYKVLREHLENDVNSFLKSVWRMDRVLGAIGSTVSFELRGAMDGALFLLPARQFMQPEFPQVSLS